MARRGQVVAVAASVVVHVVVIAGLRRVPPRVEMAERQEVDEVEYVEVEYVEVEEALEPESGEPEVAIRTGDRRQATGDRRQATGGRKGDRGGSGAGSGSESGSESGSGSGSESGSGSGAGSGSGSGSGSVMGWVKREAFRVKGPLDGWTPPRIEIPVGDEDRKFEEDANGVAVEEGLLRPGPVIGRFGPGGVGQYDRAAIAAMEETRDERYGVAATETSAHLKAALARTPRELERVWRGPGSAKERRRLLFMLWDECAESGTEQVLETARGVRAAIVAFVRRRLPAGSVDGYTVAELDALNRARTSRERFAPYRSAR